MKKVLLLILVAFVSNPLLVSADEYVIEGNGSGSDNTISVTQETTNTVEQTNNAEVTNNVDINADTGNNEANANTGGDTAITTGDINVTSEVNNENINQNSVETGCCENSTNITVTGNGAGSNNAVLFNSVSNTNVSVNNSAGIVNNVNGIANTGNNTANLNNGSVSIATGDIKVIDHIKNNNINNYAIKVVNNSGGSVTIKVKDNGTFSDNIVVVNKDNNLNIDVENDIIITNNSIWDLNTGGNEANGNLGDVSITTGDILFESIIDNSGINTGIVDVDCCEDDQGGPDPEDPDPTPPPSNNSNSSSGGSSSGSSSSSSGGTSNGGPILPITGSPSLLVLAIVTTIMFFLGWYLRLRSGRAPNIAR